VAIATQLLHRLRDEHVSFAPHVPQLATVRERPQASVICTLVPQVSPADAQSWASVCEVVQPHRFAVPPPPQVSGELHVPHSALRALPHLSCVGSVPHCAPAAWQSS
jgi:hypothetical protein